MLTAEEVWAGQADLERLCHDRALETVETNVSNAFYGHADILKRVAGFPLQRALSVTIPHGVSFAGPNIAEAQSAHATAYCYQRELDDAMSQQGTRALIRGAAPFTYVPQLVSPSRATRGGTLFFPAHSTQFTSVEAQYDLLAAALATLPAEWQPVRVCCYYMDILRGNHLPFLARGVPVVSAGHMYDPLFLVRLWHLLSRHTYAASNSHGSHTPYALFAGCRYAHMPIGSVAVRCERGYEDWWEGPRPESAALLAAVFPPYTHTDALRLQQTDGAALTAARVAYDLLGVSRQLTPPQLAAALLAAERRQQRHSA